MRRLLLKLKSSLESRLIGLEVDCEENYAVDFGCSPETMGRDINMPDVKDVIIGLYPGQSVVFYGSRVRGCSDSQSDLDIIVIDNEQHVVPGQETRFILGLKIDVTKASFTMLLQGIRGMSRNNNNWFLTALAEGIIVRDPSKDARRLKAVAKQVWANGPPAVRPRRLKMLRAGLLRLFESAEKLTARSPSSIEAEQLARMRCDQLVSQSIYTYYCVRNRWTSSFHKLVNSAKSDYPELYALWSQYAASTDQFAALGIARRIIDAVFEGTALVQITAERSAVQEECIYSSS